MYRQAQFRYLAPATVALAMIALGAITSVVNTRRTVADFKEVAHSRTVLSVLQGTLSSMQDQETGQRGYLLTGQDAYLGPYRSGLARSTGLLTQLQQLTVDNVDQGPRVTRLRELARLKEEEMERVIAVRQQAGLEAASAEVGKNRGKELMDEFRAVAKDMRQDEERLLNLRNNHLIESVEITNTTVWLTGLIAVGAGLTGTILLFLFLTSRERQNHLTREKERAEQADKAKSEFLAMMSHEIRTPMNAILGFGELLSDLVDDPREKHYAGAILTSANSLLLLINDILDLSKIEADKMDLHPEAVDMTHFSENLQTLFSFRAEEKGLEYSVNVDPAVPRVLTFDSLRLRQVMVNLVGNAIKFCREGRVAVSIWAVPVPGEDNFTLHLEVTDTGIGIPHSQLIEIFRPFYQVDSRRDRQFQGTGLGLSISQRLVALLGGKIDVASDEGEGSTFHVCVPVRRSRREGEEPDDFITQATDFNRLAPSKILIADDVPLNRELIRNYLDGSHHTIFEAENGEEAVNVCRTRKPDVVLMDVRMPVMDGIEALKALRQEATTANIPLIAVTASSLMKSQEQLKALFDGFADKPINRNRLFLELAKFLPAHDDGSSAGDFALPTPANVPAPGEWKPLATILRSLESGTWPELKHLVPAQGTMTFASRLTELAHEYRCPPLADYASRLSQAADMFDFAAAARILDGFPKVVSQIASADD